MRAKFSNRTKCLRNPRRLSTQLQRYFWSRRNSSRGLNATRSDNQPIDDESLNDELSTADDTPCIAILGAGPIGLEAALYARYLGYPVTVFERGDLCENVRAWEHVQLFTPFGMNHSPLGLAAVTTQFPGYSPPGADELINGRQWISDYFRPLCESDLLRDSIRTQTRVLKVGRRFQTKRDRHDPQSRSAEPFR